MNNHLFNSTSKPVPPIRRDIQIIPVSDNGRNLLLFIDPIKIAQPGFALDSSVEPILSLIDGNKSLTQLASFFRNNVSANHLLDFVQMLDKQKILQSRNFLHHSNRIEEEFEESEIRPPALTPSSYPSEPEQLQAFMEDTMKRTNGKQPDVSGAKALYAPHIDLRVGSKHYAEAFAPLHQLKPERVVLLATSHYSGYYPQIYEGFPFIGSTKDFELPGRTIRTDRNAVDMLAENSVEAGFILKDRAHRIEHSIETHLLFASHVWQHDFSIVPILVAGFDELFYKPDGNMELKLENFAQRLRNLDSENTFFLISGDLSHVGRKFGDTAPASDMRPDVELFDKRFIESAVSGNNKLMLETISQKYDPYRICGFPPLYLFLRAFPSRSGRQINYHWWDEQERESAVSFGSILYK